MSSTAKSAPPATGAAPGGPPETVRRTVIRCLHGPRPEHRARHLVTRMLADGDIRVDLPDVELAVSELVTNACQHAPGPYELRICFGREAVKVAVMDAGADHIALARHFLHAAGGGLADGESGRGLQIVTGLFPGAWGTEATTTCTGLTPAKQAWIMLAWPVQVVADGARPVAAQAPVTPPGTR